MKIQVRTRSKFHTSRYEDKDGWIPMFKQRPPINTKVALSYIRMLDWNLEQMEWETTGKLLNDRSWDFIQTALWQISPAKNPTHWKKIKYKLKNK